MTFHVKTPDALAEGLKGAVTTDISKSKDNEKQQDEQKTAQEFLENYLLEVVGSSIWGKGANDDRISKGLEASFISLFERYMTGCDGDNIPIYIYAESAYNFRLFNGKYFERATLKDLKSLVKNVLKASQVGNIYAYNSAEKIAKEVAETLERLRKWLPESKYFSFSNGVLNIETMQLQRHNEKIQTNNIFDCEFSENADCPIFRRCVADALAPEEAAVLQEMCGYLLFRDHRHEKIGVLVGNGRNGKSAILRAVSYALGEENGRVTHHSLQEITDSTGLFISNSIGAIANICYDSGGIKIGNEAILKRYVSGEPIVAKVLYQQPTETTAYPKSIIAVNELPQGSDFSDGFFRRFLLLPFSRQIPLEKVDKELEKKLRKERVGILLWIIEGMIRLLSQGNFSESEVIREVANRYRTDSDSVAVFLQELNLRPSYRYSRTLASFFQEFKGWLVDNGFSLMSNRKFAERLRMLGYRVERGTANKSIVWVENSSTDLLPDEKCPF